MGSSTLQGQTCGSLLGHIIGAFQVGGQGSPVESLEVDEQLLDWACFAMDGKTCVIGFYMVDYTCFGVILRVYKPMLVALFIQISASSTRSEEECTRA